MCSLQNPCGLLYQDPMRLDFAREQIPIVPIACSGGHTYYILFVSCPKCQTRVAMERSAQGCECHTCGAWVWMPKQWQPFDRHVQKSSLCTSHNRPRPCPDCAIEYQIRCRKGTTKKHRRGRCEACGNPVPPKHSKYCSEECRTGPGRGRLGLSREALHKARTHWKTTGTWA